MILSSQNIEELFECENGVRTLTSTEMTPVISEIKSLIDSDYFSDLGRDSAGNLTDKALQVCTALTAHQSKLEAAKTVFVIYSKPKKKKAKLKKMRRMMMMRILTAAAQHFCTVSVVQKKLDCMLQAHCGQPSCSSPSRIT